MQRFALPVAVLLAGCSGSEIPPVHVSSVVDGDYATYPPITTVKAEDGLQLRVIGYAASVDDTTFGQRVVAEYSTQSKNPTDFITARQEFYTNRDEAVVYLEGRFAPIGSESAPEPPDPLFREAHVFAAQPISNNPQADHDSLLAWLKANWLSGGETTISGIRYRLINDRGVRTLSIRAAA